MWATGQLAASTSRERVIAVVKALLGIELLPARPAAADKAGVGVSVAESVS